MNSSQKDNFMITITSELFDRLEQIIEELYLKIHASCVILADINGQLISHRKNRTNFNETNLAILFASHIGTTVEISREIEDKYGFNFLLHEGNDQCVFLSSIPKTFVLGIVFDNSSLVGVVRVYTKKARQKLLDTMAEFNENNKSNIPNLSVSSNLVESLAKQCDDLFDL